MQTPGVPGPRVLARERARLAEQRDHHEHVHAHEHAGDARCVDVDEGQAGLGGDHAGEEGLAGARWACEEHAFWHFAAGALEPLDALEDANEALGVIEEIRLAAIVLERQPDLRAVRCHRVGARP